MNLVYNKALEALLTAALGGTTPAGAGTIKALLIEASAYTVDPTHQFLSSVPGGARIGSAVALAGVTYTNGVFNCTSPVTFTTPPSGHQVDAWLIYLHTGTDATSTLIAYIDTGYNLPLQTNGNDVKIQIDSGANKIFALVSQG